MLEFLENYHLNEVKIDLTKQLQQIVTESIEDQDPDNERLTKLLTKFVDETTNDHSL